MSWLNCSLGQRRWPGHGVVLRILRLPPPPFYTPPRRGASALGVGFNQPAQHTLTRVPLSQSGLSPKYLIPSELSLMSAPPAHRESQSVLNDVKIIRPGQV